MSETGLTGMSKSWGAIASIAPPAHPAPLADTPELIWKLSPGLYIYKGQSYLPLTAVFVLKLVQCQPRLNCKIPPIVVEGVCFNT